MYWPNISDDIRSIVNKCEKCLANCCHNQKEPYIPFDIPIVAWKTVTTDLFVFQDKTYIVVIDLFSRFPVVRQLCGESTKLVLNALKDIFSDFGIPKIIINDNGPCYRSKEFNYFCAKFDIVHQTGASYNHQANSITEHAIQTIKHLMIKNQNDTWLALLILKSTPFSGIDRSPAKLLCNRKFMTNIPLIKHASSLADQARLQNENPTRYQTGSKELVPLNLGSCVLYNKTPDSTERPDWSKSVVTDIDGPGRKYNIQSDTGRNVTRTRQYIRPDGSYVTNSGRASRPPERLIAQM